MSSALDRRVRALLRPELAALSAYHVPSAEGLIKLDAMENPYGWPEAMLDEWLALLRHAPLNRYPDPSARTLQHALRAHAAIPDACEILLGNGSDELIQLLLMAISGRDATVIAPEPTFVMYRQLAESMGLRFIGVPLLSPDFALDMLAMREAIRRYSPAVVFLAYPNNPTGNLFADHELMEIISTAPGLVVVDEAYLPFAGASFLDRVPENAGLIVMRTLSKIGLAGLRLGYMVGAPEWIREFDKLRLPYNINVLTQLSAEFALSRAEVFDAQVGAILEQRDDLYRKLSQTPGLRAFPSRANFILFELLKEDANEVARALRERGVLIKSFGIANGILRRCLRVTVGKPEENRMFLDALAYALGCLA